MNLLFRRPNTEKREMRPMNRLLLALVVLFNGCALVPEYKTPVSKQHEELKEELKQEQKKKAAGGTSGLHGENSGLDYSVAGAESGIEWIVC